jgi:hypothetical protein
MNNSSITSRLPKLWRMSTFFMLLMVFSLGQIGGSSAGKAISSASPQGDDQSLISAKLTVSQTPALNQPVTLTCSVESLYTAPGTSVTFELPQGVQVLQGTTTWRGNLKAGKEVTVSLQIAFRQAGNSALFCQVLNKVDEKETWGARAALYFKIGQTSSQQGFDILPASQRDQNTLPDQGDDKAAPSRKGFVSASVNAVGDNPNSPDAQIIVPEIQPDLAHPLTVTGRFRYYDRNDAAASKGGYLVQLYKDSDESHLAWCWTDTDGYYSCGPVENPGVEVRTRMLSWAQYAPYQDKLVVVNPDWGTTTDTANTFKMRSPAQTFTDGTHDMGARILANGNDYERAFWTVGDLIEAYSYVWNMTGRYESPQETAGSGTVEWKIDSTDGTYYTHGENIHLAGDDPLTNKAPIHEYAHNIMYTVYGNTFPTTNCPSPHYLKLSSHVNCAWTEGWANGFVVLVNNDPVLHYSNGSTVNIETPTFGTSSWDSGDTVEGRVVGTLWDLVDNATDGYDSYDGTFEDIWDTIYNQNDDNFSQFWSAWKSRGHNENGAVLSIFQNTIDYRTCHTLTRTKTGSGVDLTLNPWNSSGCSTYNFKTGESITLTASPASGWHVDSWSGTDNNSSTSTTNTVTMPNATRTVGVNYVQNCYKLTRAHTGSGNNPTASPSSSSGCSSGYYHAGQNITLTANPSSSWTVGSWSGTNNNSSTSTTNTVTMPAANREVTVNYIYVPACYTLALLHTGSGGDPIASPSASSGCDPGDYSASESITLTAYPNNGWIVGSWNGTDNDASISTNNTLTMPAEFHTVKVNYAEAKTTNIRSQGSYDGWIRESGETSNKGGTLNKGATTFLLGDDRLDRQYRSILSFNTAGLPDNAVITLVTLKLKRQGTVGTNPFNTHGKLLVDIRNGAFGSSSALKLGDFQAKPSKNNVGNLPKKPRSGWYTKTWTSGIFPYINKEGLTQIRLRFAKDDNDDRGNDYLKFYSGNAATAYRPQLIIEYYAP